ncbi:DUF6053 domain-containing protein [Lysobacter yananisis]
MLFVQTLRAVRATWDKSIGTEVPPTTAARR